MSLMQFNRALHPDDYALLKPYVERLKNHERQMAAKGLPYRKDHEHREWEYASVLQQLDALDITPPAKILDTGSGANYFAPLLKMDGYDLAVNDSMAYGDITDWLRRQCFGLGITIPLIVSPVEKLGLEDGQWDVAMCISVIEHLAVEQFEAGIRELARVTKPGGFVFITSDFFRDEPHALKSPSLGIQHNRFYEANAVQKILDVGAGLRPVGGIDAPEGHPHGLRYRGDFVNGHSFCNFVFEKTA
jgi:SAM-dependent methyltransferase